MRVERAPRPWNQPGMTLPDFLVIGAQRAGTTWLDETLRSHPEILMARHRKEVHFFDQNFDSGADWYGSFFTDIPERISRVGETTPHYLYHPDVAARVAALLPDCQLIAILRNPVDRAYSQYGHNVKSKGWAFSFEEALEREPQVLERGRYMHQLRRYLRFFPRDRLLVLILEEATRDARSATVEVADFLGVGAEGFVWPESKANASYVPRFARAYTAARSTGRMMRSNGLDVVVEGFKRAGIPRVFGSRGRLESMSDETRTELAAFYSSDRRELEDFLGREIALWD